MQSNVCDPSRSDSERFVSFESDDRKSISPPSYPEQPLQNHLLMTPKQKMHALYQEFIKSQRNRRFLACGLWLIGSTCWVLSYLYSNNRNIAPQITILWRALSLAILSYVFNKIKGQSKMDIPDDQTFWYCTLRGTIVGLNVIIFAFCQFYLPLPYMHTLNSIIPIFTAILDFIINGVQLTQKQMAGMIGAFISVLIIILNSRQYEDTETQFLHYHNISKPVLICLEILLILNAGMVSYAFLLTKKLMKINQFVLMFNHSIVFAILGGTTYHIDFASLLNSQQSVQNSLDISTFITGFFLSGMVINLGNTLQIFALQICHESGKVVIMQNFTVILAYFISIFIYSEPISIISLIGVIFTLFFVYITIK